MTKRQKRAVSGTSQVEKRLVPAVKRYAGSVLCPLRFTRAKLKIRCDQRCVVMTCHKGYKPDTANDLECFLERPFLTLLF